MNNKYVCGFDENGIFLSGCIYKDDQSLIRPKMLNRSVVLTEVVEQDVFDLYKQGYYRNEEGKPTEPEIPELTVEEIQAQLTNVVQNALDSFAQTKGYDGIMSACSYSNSTDPVFKAEAEYCIRLRDETWRMGYTILGEVKAGIRPIPSEDELLALLPVGSANWGT